ncbi:MAG TPA: PEP-CTERM sorting domain-containing protein [Tepidisphaeraceae bacterium]|nr:PEP-CTERM sorting domain-containing protein [Tepidisphaeraceae bacterium]
MSLLVLGMSVAPATGAATTGITTPYFSSANSPLVTASPGYQLETFESGALTLPAVTLTTLHGSSVDLHSSVDGDDGVLDGDGFNGKSLTVFTQANTTGATFSFNNIMLGTYPKSAGVAVTVDIANPLIFTVFDSSNNVSGTITVPNSNTLDPSNDDFLFWASDPAGISAISVSSNNAAIHLHLDHLQFDTINTISIPEPGTLAGATIAGGVVCIGRRRRRV